MNSRNPWRISSLFSACYEFILALFLLFQMLLALLVLEVAKFLPVGRPCSCRRRHHNPFCSGHFPPFSPCRERDSGRFLETSGAPRTPTRFSRGRALSEDISTSRDASELTFPRRTRLVNEARSLSLPSAYKRKGRHNSSATLEESAFECKGSPDGETCQCIAAGLGLYDDLIEVSSEYLKQKDRGHEEVILSLLKALQVERKNLRNLYEELEEERVAAETAANEAMAMILRLQEEKSALQMEADHYQRMAEEKALHDEHAIQLLEEDLCRKENERLLLEEELNELRRRFSVDDDDFDVGKNPDPCCSTVVKPLLLLTSTNEFAKQEEQEDAIVVKSQDATSLKCSGASCASLNEESCEGLLGPEDQPVKRFKGITQWEISEFKNLQVSGETVECVLAEPHKHAEKLPFDVEDDAKAILVQLSVVEKQLLALEESEKLELWHQAQASQDSLICELLNPNEVDVDNLTANNEDVVHLQTHEDDARAVETDASTILVEEKVVDVDVANVGGGLNCDTLVPASEEIIEFHEGKRQRSKVVQWEACEEEKRLDLPSFVKSNSTPVTTSMLDGAGKPDVQCLQGIGEEVNWDAKKVTLEDINLRLRALESENTLLRHRSVSSNHEHVNLVLLKEIMQELQGLLKANMNVSVSSEALTSLNAEFKGEGQHKKRHYSDGPGQFS